MKRIMYVGNIAAPYTVKLACELMSSIYSFRFYFYEDVDAQRAKFWKTVLPPNCAIFKKVYFKKIMRYLSLEAHKEYERYNPDILILNGLTLPSNYFLYRKAKKEGKKIILYSEFLRDKKGNARSSGFYIFFLKFIYAKGFDLVWAIEEHGKNYFLNVFSFSPVESFQYPIDIDRHLRHKPRIKGRGIPILFSHRLVEAYDPILAINVISKLVCQGYPVYMFMNANGELRQECEKTIEHYNLQSVISFIENVQSWDDLPPYYQSCDISLTTASFSNGCMSIIEAHASGMGVVCTNKVLTNTQLIELNDCGLIVENELVDLVKAVKKYINDYELLNLHAINGRTAVARWSVQNTARLFESSLSRLVKL